MRVLAAPCLCQHLLLSVSSSCTLYTCLTIAALLPWVALEAEFLCFSSIPLRERKPYIFLCLLIGRLIWLLKCSSINIQAMLGILEFEKVASPQRLPPRDKCCWTWGLDKEPHTNIPSNLPVWQLAIDSSFLPVKKVLPLKHFLIHKWSL